MAPKKTAAHKLLKLEGEIDLHRSPDIKRELQEATQAQPARLLIDLSDVSYIDSSGLAVLLNGMQNVEAYGGKLFLVGPSDSVRAIFETSKLDQVFRIVPSVDAAEAVD